MYVHYTKHEHTHVHTHTRISLLPGPLRIVGDAAYFQQFVIDPRVRKSVLGVYYIVIHQHSH